MLRLNEANPEVIGAIAESSAYLADAITSIIPKEGPPKQILEVGAGTGVFTKKIIEKLGPHDHLDVVEITPALCAILNKKFNDNPLVTIHCNDILNWQTHRSYSYIISGLPFNSFTADKIKTITHRYIEFAMPGALCAFFEYKWLPTLKSLFMTKEEKNHFQKTRQVINDFINRYEKSQTNVYLNIPPATVHFLQIKTYRRHSREQE